MRYICLNIEVYLFKYWKYEPTERNWYICRFQISILKYISLNVIQRFMQIFKCILYILIFVSITAISRSRLSLTAFTSLRKQRSPMQRFWWSSHIMIRLGGYRGDFPPPTSATMLHLYNISTRPIPPSDTLRKINFKGLQL